MVTLPYERARYYVHLTPGTDAQLAAISDEEEEPEEEPAPLAKTKVSTSKPKLSSRESSAEPAAVTKKSKLTKGSKASTSKHRDDTDEAVTEEDEPSTASDSDSPAGPSGARVCYTANRRHLPCQHGSTGFAHGLWAAI